MLGVMARQRIQNSVLEQRIHEAHVAYQMESHIANLTTQTLIVWERDDRIHNVAAAETLHKLLPNSKVIILPGAGHLPMIEQAQRCVDDYLKFRRSHT